MTYKLAQMNIAKFRLPAEHPNNADFINSLDRVNAVAEEQPGFVWRLVGDGNDALDINAFDDPGIVVNMSVWDDLETLAAFAYRNEDHRNIMRRRAEWFDEMEFYLVLWWVRDDEMPTVEDGKARLDYLKEHGPSARAFTFKQPFPAPGEDKIDPVLDACA